MAMASFFRLRQRLSRVKESEMPQKEKDQLSRSFDGNIETGFQMATFHGPLCAEPMEGIAFFVERVEVDKEGLDKEIGIDRALHCTPCGVLTYRVDRTRPYVTDHGFRHFRRTGCVSKWIAGLVAAPKIGDVFM